MSHVTRWVITKVIVRAIELNKKNIYVLQIGASFCYKLGLKLLQAVFYYKLGQKLLQIGAALFYYKLVQMLQIRTLFITKQGSYYKLGQNVL